MTPTGPAEHKPHEHSPVAETLAQFAATEDAVCTEIPQDTQHMPAVRLEIIHDMSRRKEGQNLHPSPKPPVSANRIKDKSYRKEERTILYPAQLVRADKIQDKSRKEEGRTILHHTQRVPTVR